MTGQDISINNTSPKYSSFETFRVAHINLLKDFKTKGFDPEIIKKIEEFIKRGKATGVFLDREEERWTAQSQLDYWTTQLYRPDYIPPDATLDDFDPELAPDLDNILCPYMGLDAFQEKNKNIYFGRENLVSELINKLQILNFLAITGPSGSGKSSLVRAGLLPRLKAGELPESDNWLYFPTIVPGSKPLLSLARLLSDENNRMILEEDISDFLSDDAHLFKLVSKKSDKNVVIFVDQFEEIFTLCSDENERQAFVRNLIYLCNSNNSTHRIVITLRSDFEANIALLPDLYSLIELASIRVTPLSASDLRKVIESPAATIGLKFEDGVVDSLLRDTLGEPAALPLLQFTLLKLWENRVRNRITLAAYKKLGGGRKALEQSAEELYNHFINEEQLTMRRILLKLVRPSEGLEVTSNRIPVSIIYKNSESNERILFVLNKLIQARLVKISEGDLTVDDQVEIAHEALIRNWHRLVEWIEDERSSLRQRHRLSVAAEEWDQLGRATSILWDSGRLWRVHQYDDLSSLENEFIKASYSLVYSEEDKKYKRLIATWITTSMIVGLILGGIILIYSIQYFGRDAQKNRAIAETQIVTIETQSAIIGNVQASNASLAATAISAENTQVNIILANKLTQKAQALTSGGTSNKMAAFLLAIYANRLYPTSDSSQILVESQLAYPTLQFRHDTSVDFAGFSPSGKNVISATRNKILIWDANTGLEISQLRFNEFISSIVVSPDSKVIFASVCAKTDGVVCRDGELYAIEVSTGQELWKQQQGDFISSLTIDSNGRFIASAGCEVLSSNGYCIEGSVRIRSIQSGLEINRIVHKGAIEKVVFSPDGKYIASFGSDTSLRILDIITGAEFTRMVHDDIVSSVSFSPNSNYLVSGSSDHTARVWDVSNGNEVSRFLHPNDIALVSFSPDSKYILSVDLDNYAFVWDANTGKEILSISQIGGIFSAEFSPDGEYILLGSNDKSAYVWEISTAQKSAVMVHDAYLTSAGFSPDGMHAISAGLDGLVYTWLYKQSDIKYTMTDFCSLATRNLTFSEWDQYVGGQPYELICPKVRFEPVDTSKP